MCLAPTPLPCLGEGSFGWVIFGVKGRKMVA